MTSAVLTSRFAITICLMALLVAVSIVPGRARPGDSFFVRLVANTPPLLQKLLHVLLYAVLTVQLVRTFDAIPDTSTKLVLAILIAVSFGSFLEWYQTKVPGRFGTIFDAALNALGALLGALTSIVFG